MGRTRPPRKPLGIRPPAYDDRMPRFSIKVAASWDPKIPINPKEELFSTGEKFRQDPELFRQLGDWVSSPPGGWEANVAQDHGFDPARMTLEVLVADVDAPSEWGRSRRCLLVRSRRTPATRLPKAGHAGRDRPRRLIARVTTTSTRPSTDSPCGRTRTHHDQRLRMSVM